MLVTSFIALLWVELVNADVENRVNQEKSLIEAYVQFSEISNTIFHSGEFPIIAYEKL